MLQSPGRGFLELCDALCLKHRLDRNLAPKCDTVVITMFRNVALIPSFAINGRVHTVGRGRLERLRSPAHRV